MLSRCLLWCATLLAATDRVSGAVPAALWGGRIKPPTGATAWSELRERAGPSTVEQVNEAFATRGVFVHQFDALQDYSKPWLVNTTRSSFTSVSIASGLFPYIYSTALGGMLFSYEFVGSDTQSPVRCACACDCDSMSRGPLGCSNVTKLAGSQPDDTGCLAEKSTVATAYRTVDDMLVRLDPKPNSRCVWTPSQPYDNNPSHVDSHGRVRPPPGETRLSHFSCMYNEIVLDGAAVNRAMPSVLDAFFFTQNCWRDPHAHELALPTSAKQVQAVYEQFMADHPSANAPLFLSFDCARAARNEPPFSDASQLWMEAIHATA